MTQYPEPIGPLIWCCICGRDSLTNYCETCKNILDSYNPEEYDHETDQK